MHPPIPRRTAFKVLAGALAAPALSFAAESKVEGAKWKTAIGLNGFQSGSRKYKKNYPIWCRSGRNDASREPSNEEKTNTRASVHRATNFAIGQNARPPHNFASAQAGS